MDEPMDDAGEDNMEGTLVPGQPDINGDGEVIIGIASPGDTNDGGFYQSFVDGVTWPPRTWVASSTLWAAAGRWRAACTTASATPSSRNSATTRAPR